MKYNRILLKLSGESLQGTQKYGLSTDVLHSYAEQIKAVVGTGVQVGIVIGGGNIFRGLQGARKGTRWACWPRSSTRWPCSRPSRTTA